MQTLQLPVSLVTIGERQRKDYGNIDDLADSLDRYGLIQPIVLADDNTLIAGGRRLAAAIALGWTEIKVCYYGSLTEEERLELELEENVRRLDINWQERVLAIADIHNRRRSKGALSGDRWTERATGELLGQNQASVHFALVAAELLSAGDEEVMECENMFAFTRLLLQRKEDEVLREAALEQDYTNTQVEVVDGQLVPRIRESPQTRGVIAIQCYNRDAVEFLQHNDQQFDHIITDPPYGINTENIEQTNIGLDVSRTANEHQVTENLVLVSEFIEAAYTATKETAFCVFWCDQEHWHLFKEWAIRVGWRVQRWPLVWIKTDVCQNSAAQYNFTKRTEIAMVLRKPNAVLAKHCGCNYWIGQGEDKQQFSHPFAKPLDLHKWVIESVSHTGQTILDPFAGSGTCPAACILLDRRPVAVELVEVHYNECLNNLKRTYRQVYGEETQFQ